MSDFLSRVAVDWHLTLERLLASARQAGREALLVFDLDSTVFDNRPRQARIVREFGAARGLDGLKLCQPWHFTTGWDLRGAMRACGFSADDAERLFPDLKAFWQDRFFTSDYARDDIEIVGAPRYLNAVAATGARLYYVTGRHEDMRAGSIDCLKRCGLPVPAADGPVQLWMKPTLRESDDAYKRDTHVKLHAAKGVLAAFDNEPTHINDYATQFPDATAVHLATDHSGREVKLNERCVSIPHFAY